MTPLCQYIWDFHVSLLYLHTYIYTIFSSWFLRSLYTGRNICNLLAFFVPSNPAFRGNTYPTFWRIILFLVSFCKMVLKFRENADKSVLVRDTVNDVLCDLPIQLQNQSVFCDYVQERDPEYWWWLQQENLLNRSAGCTCSAIFWTLRI